MKVNLPTGVPLVYEFDDNFNVISKQYLGDPEVIAAKITKSRRRVKNTRECVTNDRTSRALNREVLLCRGFA